MGYVLSEKEQREKIEETYNYQEQSKYQSNKTCKQAVCKRLVLEILETLLIFMFSVKSGDDQEVLCCVTTLKMERQTCSAQTWQLIAVLLMCKLLKGNHSYFDSTYKGGHYFTIFFVWKLHFNVQGGHDIELSFKVGNQESFIIVAVCYMKGLQGKQCFVKLQERVPKA